MQAAKDYYRMDNAHEVKIERKFWQRQLIIEEDLVITQTKSLEPISSKVNKSAAEETKRWAHNWIIILLGYYETIWCVQKMQESHRHR